MTQLTEERFEEILTQKLAPLATKEDVHREVREGVEELARMVSSGFADIRDRLDVRERVVRVENGLQRIAKELHISL
jgi:hypothetical protein